MLAVEEKYRTRIEGEVLAKILGTHRGKNVWPGRVLIATEI